MAQNDWQFKVHIGIKQTDQFEYGKINSLKIIFNFRFFFTFDHVTKIVYISISF
jgi:hypothetical protein